MIKEIYWEKALAQSEISISRGSLFPLDTSVINNKIYKSDDFLIKKLDTSKFKKNFVYGPKVNPFNPWEKDLEIEKIGNNHQLILNKYPVQLGHILLITNDWKPQIGWLDIDDWLALKTVNNDTSGLWFFNSGPLSGASQPHRHLQLLRRSSQEIICPREKWILGIIEKPLKNKVYEKKIKVKKFNLSNNAESLYKTYLEIANHIGLGDPINNELPLFPYNLLITNNWIAIIRRSKDYKLGFNINALGFAGYILITDNSNLLYLEKNGAEKLLENFI
tara:strand:+ start:6688 stop:7518 length:831 start_codon:yes stop_codon:yes gene_type:complete